MSKSGKERSNFRGGGGGGGGGSGDGDDGDEDDEGVRSRDDGKKRREYGCGRNLGKAKQVVLFPFRKAKKQLVYSGRKRSRSSSSSASFSGKREGFVGCFLCFKQPQTMESPANSQTSDPNNPAFTYEHLKVLIEKNDFYSKECNPHIDIPSFADWYIHPPSLSVSVVVLLLLLLLLPSLSLRRFLIAWRTFQIMGFLNIKLWFFSECKGYECNVFGHSGINNCSMSEASSQRLHFWGIPFEKEKYCLKPIKVLAYLKPLPPQFYPMYFFWSMDSNWS